MQKTFFIARSLSFSYLADAHEGIHSTKRNLTVVSFNYT